MLSRFQVAKVAQFNWGGELVETPNPRRFLFTFTNHAFERLLDTLYAVFELAITDRQIFGDDVRASRYVLRVGGTKKDGLISVEFMHGIVAGRDEALSS